MSVISKRPPALKSLSGALREADLFLPLGEGRRRSGRTGQVHRATRRDRGSSTQGKTRRDNAGKGHLPAGAGSNQQRPAVRGTTEGSGRDLVWRMGPYERRRMGNAIRDGTRCHPRRGNTSKGQRRPGHSAVLGWSPDSDPGTTGPRSKNEPRKQTMVGRGVCEPALELPRLWEGFEGKAEVRTGFGKSDRPGS